jgi:anti-repressor protein
MNIEKYQFNNEEIQILLDDNNEPWWIANEVCKALQIKNPRDAVSRLQNEDKSAVGIADAIGRNQQTTVINEFGLYDLALVSRTEKAKQFKRWITHEVIPSIRKTGSYGLPSNPKEQALLLATQLLESQKEIEQLEDYVKELTPKAKFHDAIICSNDCITVAEMAKLLGTGQKRLFKWLREHDILMKNNQPKQYYLDRGYFDPNETKLANGRLYLQTMVTPKGQVWLSNKYEV